MHVWDVRLEAPLPELTATAVSVTRGQSTTLTFDEPPRTEYLWWKFESEAGPIVTRTYDIDSNEWSGMMVQAGIAKLRVRICEDIFDLELPIDVVSRSWANGAVSSWYDDYSNTIGCISVYTLDTPPSDRTDLGMGCPVYSVEVNFGLVADDGPNAQWHYASSFSTAGTFYKYIVNSHAADSGSAFYQAQTGIPPIISGANLLEGLHRHEGGLVNGHYGEWVDEWFQPENNYGYVLESLVAPPDSSAAIEDAAEDQIDIITSQIETYSQTEVCSPEYDYTCTIDRGIIVF
jgi:hypothetical protein